ncbi:calcium-binding protein CP1-like [Musa acuminata AAA Group]|uniref:calcium-binding protein CP1-like n=1 Tax=Musa acuminata AAA Group TaxID=214697 RepID=UPI0031DE1B5D
MCPAGRGLAPAPLRPAFDVLDADRDGKISQDDLKAFFSSGVAAALSDEDIGSMISAADADRDGLVEFEEFERVLGRPRGGDGVMAEAFRVMDRDGDGKVGFGDLKAYLKMAGLPASDDDIWTMIRMGGSDGISFDALVKILAVDLANGP